MTGAKPAWDPLRRSALRGFERIDQQHRTGHRTDTTGHGGDPARHFADVGEVDVAAELALVVAVHADVDHHGAAFDHVGGDHVALAHGRHDHVGLQGVGLQVLGGAVANRHRGVLLQQHQGHRLAHDVAAADNHGVLATQVV